MTDRKIVNVVVVICDGTVDRVYADSEIKVVVVEPDLIEDDLCERVWEPIVCDLAMLKVPANLSEVIVSTLI